jgi:hypothetical protein
MKKSSGYIVLSYYYQAYNMQFRYVGAKKRGKTSPFFMSRSKITNITFVPFVTAVICYLCKCK